jgi:hypothetical protein
MEKWHIWTRLFISVNTAFPFPYHQFIIKDCWDWGVVQPPIQTFPAVLGNSSLLTIVMCEIPPTHEPLIIVYEHAPNYPHHVIFCYIPSFLAPRLLVIWLWISIYIDTFFGYKSMNLSSDASYNGNCRGTGFWPYPKITGHPLYSRIKQWFPVDFSYTKPMNIQKSVKSLNPSLAD